MMILIFLLLVSVCVNVVLFWYVRKLVQQLSFGVSYTQQLQGLLEEYCTALEGMLEMETYYGDDTMTAAVKNTKMVIETCKLYEKSVLRKEDEMSENDNTENSEG
jgi:hypothetical protein